MEPCGSQRCSFPRIFEDATIPGNKYPLFGCLSKVVNPFYIGGMSAIRQSRNILYVECCVTVIVDEAVKCGRYDCRNAVIK